MMDIVPYQDFLKSLSDISHWQFEVWDGRGPVFTTIPGGLPTGERETLVSTILTENRFQIHTGTDRLLVGAPLRIGGAPTGALLAWNNDTSDLVGIEQFLLCLTEVLGHGWATSTELDKITTELSQSYEDVYLYGRLSSLIKTMHFSVHALNDLIGEIRDALHADLVFVTIDSDNQLIMNNNQLFNRMPADNADFAKRLIAAIPADSPSLKEHYVIVNDSRLSPNYRELYADPYRALLVTIQDGKKFYGWIGVVSFNVKQIFRRSELRLLISIAEQINVAITNTDLYNELERFIVDMVKSLVQAIEIKDTYTRGHSERVCRYSMLLAEKMGLDEEQKANLQWAGMLHDVGKIGITETILNKPGPLTEDEYEQVKTHPTKGYAILKLQAPLKDALPGILHHHERYDGKGYPDGLKGENIPLLGRIIAVPDTFDAITSNRAYREGSSVQKALKILQSVSGSQLDARIVEIFTEIIVNEEGSREEEGTGEKSQ
ncbi:MAG: HD domain-containing protein [Syntrophales bacterium]|jgi:HD-GYP domain-containing protein (c-di-GMP phosphodiesterase class II)|nr:HD domain-containing protein [Syntrophales bacterium]